MSRKEDIAKKIMSDILDFAVKISRIIKKDSRYDAEVYSFAMKSLHYTLSRFKEHRHITGRELLEGMREYGLKQFGPMTRTVLSYWGVSETKDFGEVVFNMIDVGLMKRRPEDKKEEFYNVYDFETAFDKPYRKTIRPRISYLKKRKKKK